MAIVGSDRLAVFAGTTEGHELAAYFRDRDMLERADFFVATDYGRSTLSDIPEAHIICGRLGLSDMQERLGGNYRLVIDATHPYAVEVTENLKNVCGKTGLTYLRLLREEDPEERSLEQDAAGRNITVVRSTEEAASLLDSTEGRFLLTTGAKELPVFAGVREFPARCVARVLPSESSLEACRKAGIPMKSIIGMQGPFTLEMNRATMRQYGLQILVTKSTGKAGGFADKAALADEGYRIIVIGRPVEEEGLSMKELKERLDRI